MKFCTSFNVGKAGIAPLRVVVRAPIALANLQIVLSLDSSCIDPSSSKTPNNKPATNPSPAPVVSTTWTSYPSTVPVYLGVTYMQPYLPRVTISGIVWHQPAIFVWIQFQL